MTLLVLLGAAAVLLSYWNLSPEEILVPALQYATNVVTGDEFRTVPSTASNTASNRTNATTPTPTSPSADAATKVLIIGAGTAGLFTAYTLSYFGLQNYRILEASSNIGGRVQEKKDFLDVPIDLGAEWIHGDPKILQDLLLYAEDEANVAKNVKTISYQPQTWSVYTRGKRRRRDWFRFYYREFKFFNRTWYSYLRDYVASRLNMEIRNIEYNATVASIDYSSTDGLVRVTTRDGRDYRADKVIVTIPLAVMKNVTFTPPLPANKVDAMERVYVAPGIKAWIEFSKRFYADVVCTSNLYGFYDESNGADPVYFNAVYGKPSTRHALAYFSVGTATEKLAFKSNEEIFRALMAQLDTILDGQATKYYKQHYIQNWATVPHVQGAYSDDWNEDDASFDDIIAHLARPVNGKLYFCGEHTHATQVATVHGAALSGRRAAQEVVADFMKRTVAATYHADAGGMTDAEGHG